VEPYLDGSIPEEAEVRRRTLNDMLEKRRGKSGMARFDHERLL
jgi:hypothetical protein